MKAVSHDLEPLSDWIMENRWPTLPCPACHRRTLAPEKLVTQETEQSERWHSEDHWEPEWISGFFHGTFRCANTSCREVAVAVGDMKVDAVFVPGTRNWHGEYGEFLLLRSMLPALPLIDWPDRAPQSVRERVDDASRVLWSDANSAANRLRAAVEELLTAQRIRKQDDKRKRLSTHARIELLREKKSVVADVLEAVKWIGNEGSHEDVLSVVDVLRGAALLEKAVHLIYDTSEADLLRLAKEINKKKGLSRR